MSALRTDRELIPAPLSLYLSGVIFFPLGENPFPNPTPPTDAGGHCVSKRRKAPIIIKAEKCRTSRKPTNGGAADVSFHEFSNLRRDKRRTERPLLPLFWMKQSCLSEERPESQLGKQILSKSTKGASRYDVRIRGGGGHGKADVVREVA